MFNPFPSFGRELQIASLQFELTLSGQGKEPREITRSIEVRPLPRKGHICGQSTRGIGMAHQCNSAFRMFAQVTR